MKYDYIVIGAGVSGLTSAVILAKNGFRVALVEKAEKTGPLLGGFVRNGIFFDTGFHHAGNIGKGETGDVFFRYLGLSDGLERVPCNPDCFDVVRFLNPEFEFQFPIGYDRIRERLHNVFPNDKLAVDKYLEAMKSQCATLPYLNLDADFGALEALKSVNGPSLEEFMDDNTENELLKAVLSTHCLLNGVPPQEQALSNYAYIVGPYYESVHRVIGGGAAIIREFDKALAKAGVDVFCNSPVEKISVSASGVFNGVRLQDGAFLEAGGCISTIHPLNLLEIVPESVFRPAYVHRLKNLDETPSAFIFYGEVDSIPDILSGSSIYLFPSTGSTAFNVDAPLEKRPFNIASTCLRNGNSTKDGIIAICPANLAETRQWEDSFTGKRPEGYAEFKDEIARRMLRHIESSCPELRGKIKPVNCSTPLTMRDYASNPFGSMYGVKHKTEQYNPFPTTRLPGLLLAGQSIVAPGLMGAVISGFVACGNILGNDHLRKDLKKCS
jgi:all-trans-retinol 13,14-reductase